MYLQEQNFVYVELLNTNCTFPMERSSRVGTTARKPKNLNFFQKSLKLNFDLCQRAKITLGLSISILH